MRPHLELGYIGVEVADVASFGEFLTDVVGLVPGDPWPSGELTWRNDAKAHRIIVRQGQANDAVYLGLEAATPQVFEATAERIQAAGYDLSEGTAEEKRARQVTELVHTMAPWGIRVELVHGLEEGAGPFESPLVQAGFLTGQMGFGHAVFATPAFDEAHNFITAGLGFAQSDWLETEIGPGLPLEVHFYHCNPRHHSLAVAQAPFELPQKLHHIMVETNSQDDVGRAFDRAWQAGLGIANGLGRHDNDGMFSFYVVTPAGFQVEVGHGARVIGEDWAGDRRYDRISAWGHQPLNAGGSP